MGDRPSDRQEFSAAAKLAEEAPGKEAEEAEEAEEAGGGRNRAQKQTRAPSAAGLTELRRSKTGDLFTKKWP